MLCAQTVLAAQLGALATSWVRLFTVWMPFSPAYIPSACILPGKAPARRRTFLRFLNRSIPASLHLRHPHVHTLSELLGVDFGEPPHSLVICGETDPDEDKLLERHRVAADPIKQSPEEKPAEQHPLGTGAMAEDEADKASGVPDAEAAPRITIAQLRMKRMQHALNNFATGTRMINISSCNCTGRCSCSKCRSSRPAPRPQSSVQEATEDTSLHVFRGASDLPAGWDSLV